MILIDIYTITSWTNSRGIIFSTLSICFEFHDAGNGEDGGNGAEISVI